VMLSEDTMKKQKGERLGHAGHTDVTLEDYQALPTLISQPEAVLTKGDQRLLLLGLSDKVLALVIKTTAAADKNYLVSLHRAAPIALRRWARTQTLLLGSVERLLAMAAKKPGKE
jgi:hypothetical protein